MTDNNEVERYIKCSKCKLKYKNNDIDIAHDFGYNRLNEQFKTCFICRNKQKKKREDSKKEIKDEHYDEIDRELRYKYEEEFKIDSRDKNVKRFTEEEQVDRYAKMLFFWDINQVLNPDDVISDPKLTAKYFYISNMRSQTYHTIMTRFDDRTQKLIFERYKKLAENHNEERTVEKSKSKRRENSKKEEKQEEEKYIIVMDVETNGLIKQRGITPTRDNLHLFPNIVQFSWGLYRENGECKVLKDYIIKPNGWSMNGKEQFHGITLEKANNEGVDIKTVLSEYKYDIENCCSIFVCHNMDFDKRVVLSEFVRNDMDLNNPNEFCTMKNTINYCKITPKVRGEYK